MTRKIFMSYAREDYVTVVRLRDEIHRRTGVLPWMDVSDVKTGDPFDEKIAKAIDGCELLIVVLSRHSVTSPWTKREVSYAQEKGKRIFPVVVDDVKLPDALGLRLTDVNRIDVQDKVQREKFLSEVQSFCVEHRIVERPAENENRDVISPKRNAPLDDSGAIIGSRGKSSAFWLSVVSIVLACLVTALGYLILHKGKSEVDTGGAKAPEGPGPQPPKPPGGDPTCDRLLRETILLHARLVRFVQVGALAEDDPRWIAACKRADGYPEWVVQHKPSPEARTQERTAIRDNFKHLLERIEGGRRVDAEQDAREAVDLESPKRPGFPSVKSSDK